MYVCSCVYAHIHKSGYNTPVYPSQKNAMIEIKPHTCIIKSIRTTLYALWQRYRCYLRSTNSHYMRPLDRVHSTCIKRQKGERRPSRHTVISARFANNVYIHRTQDRTHLCT